jgi:signal transduction histidine kinase
MELVKTEMGLGTGDDARIYSLGLTHLVDGRGEELGYLLLLHDMTGQMRAQEQLMRQQQVVATLRERERLARELHDSIGQVLGYVSMQAQTAHKWAAAGNVVKTLPILSRLAEVAQDAHADVRESILSLRTGMGSDWTFVPALRQYLDHFQSSFGIGTVLLLPEELTEDAFDPVVGVQVMRVIQEALTNARKHGGAHNVKILFEQGESHVIISISDDGSGFNPADLSPEAGKHFGLTFMRERMLQIGGSVFIESHPGSGTTVTLYVPFGMQTGGQRHEDFAG